MRVELDGAGGAQVGSGEGSPRNRGTCLIVGTNWELRRSEHLGVANAYCFKFEESIV